MAARQGSTAGSSRAGNEARAGRPRRDGRAVVGDPPDEILRVAATLFGELGVAATTMSRIAAEVGLGQSSLYYYFRSREEVAGRPRARANVVSLDLVTAVGAEELRSGEAAALRAGRRRGRFCALPFDINRGPPRRSPRSGALRRLWHERARLERRLAAIVRLWCRRRRAAPGRRPHHRTDDHGQRRRRAETGTGSAPAAARPTSVARWAELTVAGPPIVNPRRRHPPRLRRPCRWHHQLDRRRRVAHLVPDPGRRRLPGRRRQRHQHGRAVAGLPQRRADLPVRAR